MEQSLVPGGGNGLSLQSSPGAAMPSSPNHHTECDMSRMPDSPLRTPGHRRALSDMIGLPDDLDLGGGGAGDGPSLSSDENEEELFYMFINVDKLNSPGGASESESSCAVTGGGGGEATRTMSAAPGAGVKPRHHHHSHSMDASSSITTEQLFGTPAMMEGMSSAEAKKAMSAAKLAELALIDPKKAKRIINNRQSAARSKERKMRYISELERKVQFMQREATALSTQLALLQRDTAGLSAENSELKIRLQNTEHQVHLQDALNDALKLELQRLKVTTGQMGNGGGMVNFGPFGGNQPMFHANHNQAMQPFLSMQQLPNPSLHPLQAQQLQQAALGLNLRGPAPAPSSQVSWGEAWSESSSG
ncbi:hypothetical protein PR202_gb02494 [Eleusine coracana subsp. coracana]|uniref:BZIP domain-containing protein n=1 Tax=Eleusine coracana subsp. coracana TaxID=191504 RepID=A0AAV5DZ58_ELECO|nr:hypothetical protein QOZ80_8BG0667850 [Eleusine coracana subsp. coracana]GJN15571.1 hypothetical protein PR202_gb02494 [Eleusine coracana subsp. coracana]